MLTSKFSLNLYIQKNINKVILVGRGGEEQTEKFWVSPEKRDNLQ